MSGRCEQARVTSDRNIISSIRIPFSMLILHVPFIRMVNVAAYVIHMFLRTSYFGKYGIRIYVNIRIYLSHIHFHTKYAYSYGIRTWVLGTWKHMYGIRSYVRPST